MTLELAVRMLAGTADPVFSGDVLFCLPLVVAVDRLCWSQSVSIFADQVVPCGKDPQEALFQQFIDGHEVGRIGARSPVL